jgi:hypothetical protein
MWRHVGWRVVVFVIVFVLVVIVVGHDHEWRKPLYFRARTGVRGANRGRNEPDQQHHQPEHRNAPRRRGVP